MVNRTETRVKESISRLSIFVQGSLIVILFALLVIFGKQERITSPHAYFILLAISVLLVVEIVVRDRPSIWLLVSTPLARAGIIAAYLTLAILLVIYTRGAESKYSMIFLLPIISAATTYRISGSLLVTLLAVGGYSAFLLIGPENPKGDEVTELIVNCIFFTVVGFLVNSLSLRERSQGRKYQILSEELQTRNLQLTQAQQELRHQFEQLAHMEDQVRRQDRLAALGEMAAGIAHEVRNPLGVIQCSVELLHKKIHSIDPNDRLAHTIVEEIQHLNKVVTEFLTFARPPTPRMETCRLEEMVERALAFLEPEMERVGIKVRHHRETPSATCLGDKELLHRVFLNVLLNAVEAMEEGEGRLDITTEKNDGGTPMATVAFHDSGQGIPEMNRKKVFNPFFTTKPEGTGLGLTIVHQIVEAHGGSVHLASRTGEGTTVTIHLPTLPVATNVDGNHPDR